MNGYNPRKFPNKSSIGTKQPTFNFKNNVKSAYKMPSCNPPPVATNRISRLMSKVCEKPTMQNDRSSYREYIEDSVTSESGYASAMEPMNCDEWGWDEDNYVEKATHVDNNLSKRKAQYVHTPMENLMGKKNLIDSYFPGMIQTSTGILDFSPKPLRQSVLNVDNSTGLGFKLEQNRPKRAVMYGNFTENGARIFPKWGSSFTKTLVPKINLEGKEHSFPRIFTVTVEKLLQWPKMLGNLKVIFELYGILESTFAGRFPLSKRITLKSEKMKDCLTCTFYEIDRTLPIVEKGQWLRCIILLRQNSEYQCVKIRIATSTELKNLNNMIMVSSKSKAMLLKHTTA